MDARDLLVDNFERIRELYVDLPDGLDLEAAHHRPAGTGNPIAWLLWHTARVQDDHVAGLTGGRQAWEDSWADRFGLPFDRRDIGYGHSSDDVDAVRDRAAPGPRGLPRGGAPPHPRVPRRRDADELDRIVDRHWNPPVTAGVRLVSLLGDCLQHLGQAAYVKGLPLATG